MDEAYGPPVILSMDGRVRYLTIARGTYDRSTLSMPLDSLPELSRSDAWNCAYISRGSSTGELKTEVGNETVPGVHDIWHPGTLTWEISRLSQETRIYKSLENTSLASRFLGHAHEHGRVIGILLEKLEGREANIEDLSAGMPILKYLHNIGIRRGDVNRCNFIIQNETGRLADFERSQAFYGDAASLEAEIESLIDQLNECAGRGGGFQFKEA
ncbi:uncharacterized protein BDW43DRAFT_318857 [Aspergillus alliaceus]|uniref:uncharacterized protein n=1 Tax=Petromyces alliaceus TaxID=209559 RepID=UPI0012A5E3D2|nr:uncharacterized protein BDW43DRAFT_318857 [Aspergillus alliaceus]KAB8234608.1 hypothetical protein BDW43DRAFT_318857 [Aspergillus alliaceus]